MTGIAHRLTFFNYFAGVGIFTFFAASFNTDEQTYIDFKTCHATVDSINDVIEIGSCHQILIPAYLAALAALCVTLAMIEGIVRTGHAIQIYIWCYFYASDRHADRQVLRLEAQRELEHEVMIKLEEEGLFS